MSDSQIGVIRSFNRIVTERVGALDDQYLSRNRPLGASRVLWEVGRSGSDVRSLRTRLDLDSGYLSRLLKSLEEEGLVEVLPDPADARVRAVRLTETGTIEHDLLDRLSDQLAEEFLAPLSERQRLELVEAAGTVERLLTAGMIDINVEDPTTEAAMYSLASYFRELDERFEGGFEVARSLDPDAAAFSEPSGFFLVARLRHQPVGCAALKLEPGGSALVKRMWVSTTVRGLGLGRRLLVEVEQLAADHGVETLRLETNRTLTEAIDLYRSAGYQEVDPFNDEPFAHHWFEKRLQRQEPFTP